MQIFQSMILLLITSLYSQATWAVFGFLKVTVNGSVESRPCKINDGKPIEIDFNNVLAADIENEFYKRKMDYTLTCPATASSSLLLKFTGDSAGFDRRYLKTSVENLGVLFKAENNNIYMGNTFGFDYRTLPNLYVVLMKKENADLPSGAFNATATMQVNYN